MNTYFIHNGNESTGPFGLDELKNRRITKSTPVWCQGMEDWKYAGEVAELQSILTIVPPPLQHKVVTTEVPNTPLKATAGAEDNEDEDEDENDEDAPARNILGIKRDIFIAAVIILVLAIGTVSFNLFEQNRKTILEQKNMVTERNNEQYLIQQREIEEQKQRLAEQERREAARILAEKKQKLNNRLSEIQNMLPGTIRNLEAAKNRMVEANSFEFLRTVDEKYDELNLIQNDIDHWIAEIDKLQQEKEQIYLELEKLQPKVSGVTDLN